MSIYHDSPEFYEAYAKGRTPAAEPVELTVEEESQGLARRINATHGGEKHFNVGKVVAEIRTLERNIENGYPG